MRRLEFLCSMPRPAGAIALTVALGASGAALAPFQAAGNPPAATPATPSATASEPTLEETRITMGKWIETQQIIGRERNEWTQGKEILKGRIELVAKEVATLDEKIKQAQTNVAESKKGYDELIAEREQLKSAAAQLVTSVTTMEAEVRKLAKMLPDPVRQKLQPLFARLPEDAATTKVSVAERFQNVLGILNEVNKANSEMTVVYEVRALPDGTNAEVQCIYVGLAQAYYISPRGEAGIGRPTADGWKWQSAPNAANGILTALEIIQGKHAPAFVPLPVNIQ
jgi:hypothetical protein